MTKSTAYLLTVLMGVASVAAAETVQEQLLERLATDYAAWQRAAEAFRVFAPRAAARERGDYEAYLAGLREHVLEDCLALAEAGYSGLTSDRRCDPVQAQPPAGIAMPRIEAEQTPTERVAALDAELTASIGDFDEMLLEEERKVKAEKPQTDAYGGSAGGGSAGGAQGESGDASGDGEQASGETGDDGQGEPQTGGDQVVDGETGQPGGDNADPAGKGGDRRRAAASAPDDIPDGHDDDVVARQLREAAEKETDPELRAKLWEEYRKYKQGSG